MTWVIPQPVGFVGNQWCGKTVSAQQFGFLTCSICGATVLTAMSQEATSQRLIRLMQLISYLSATPNPLQGKAPLLTIFHSLRSGFFIQHLGTCVLQHRKEHLNTLILSDTIPYYNNLINLQESFSLAMAYSGVMPLPGAVDDSLCLVIQERCGSCADAEMPCSFRFVIRFVFWLT